MKIADAYTRKFIEWSKFHGCPILVENENGEWVKFLGNKFNWKKHMYKIENKAYEDYYSRLYAHGMN
jgi:hypothetical protein